MVRIALAGDISLNGDYCRKDGAFLSKAFEDVRRFLDENSVDIFIANLESPLESGSDENLSKDPRVKTNRTALGALKSLPPSILILGNNHIYDCLEKGYDDTLAWLKENAISYAGTSKTGQVAPYRFTVKGQKFSLLSYVAEDTHPSIPEDASVHLDILEPSKVVRAIKEEARDSFVIVSLHWGIEFSHYPSPLQIKMARDFADAGAGIIFGHHSHELQGSQARGSCRIFYSLGNFAFADVMDAKNPVLWTDDQRHGGLALVAIDNGVVSRSALRIIHNRDLAVTMVDERSWQERLRRRTDILKMSEADYGKFWRRYQFCETIVKPPFRYFFGERANFLKRVMSVRPAHYKKIAGYLRAFNRNTGQ